MNDVTHRDDPTSHDVVEPHQHSRDEKQHSTHRNRPEVDLLPAIEEAHIFRLNFMLLGCILADTSDPAPISLRPGHRRKPVQKLEKEKEIEEQAKPRMERACSGSTAKERCYPAK